MKNAKKIKTVLSLVFLSSVILIHPQEVHAWFWNHHQRQPIVVFAEEPLSIVIGGKPYYYCDGIFYRRVAKGYVVVSSPIAATVTVPETGTLLPAPAIGSFVASLPAGTQSVMIDGVTYYYGNGVYYQETNFGYQVIVSPLEKKLQTAESANVATRANSQKSDDSFTVNVPNANGGYTPVIIKRSGHGFVGPQGEYYPEFPSVEHLRVMYIK